MNLKVCKLSYTKISYLLQFMIKICYVNVGMNEVCFNMNVFLNSLKYIILFFYDVFKY